MVPLTDRRGKVDLIQAYGIERISSEMDYVEICSLACLFKGLKPNEVTRARGEVDVLIGINHCELHPSKEQIIGSLILYSNRYGKCLAGCHERIKGNKQPSINSAYINLVIRPKIKDFFDIEEMGVNCTPKCGSCRCGKCSLGSKNFSIKEERELNLIEAGLEHKGDHFVATYPWKKDPNLLPNNKMIAHKMLENTERRLMKHPEY